MVVAVGFGVGYGAATASGTPRSQFRSVLAACGFGNSTGLPITLLTVVHSNFPVTSDLGHIDPTLFLSVYLLLYPVLQWGIGGWLLAPEDADYDDDDKDVEIRGNLEDDAGNTNGTNDEGTTYNFSKNVLNNKAKETFYKYSRNAMGETDASLYISDADLVSMATQYATIESDLTRPQSSDAEYTNGQTTMTSTLLSPIMDEDNRKSFDNPLPSPETVPLNDVPPPPPQETTGLLSNTQPSHRRESGHSVAAECESESFWETFEKVMSRCFQPPVVGALAGIVVAATPLRGTFVDLVDRGSHAPLQFLFDGLYNVGTSAVPINMMILGCNLSASYTSQMQKPMPEVSVEGGGLRTPSNLLSKKTLIAIVIGKMLIMPLIGVALALFLDTFVLSIPEGTLRWRTFFFSFFGCRFRRVKIKCCLTNVCVCCSCHRL